MLNNLKKLINKLNQGYIYVVDYNTFVEYLKKEINFSSENNLEAVVNMYIYLDDQKYHLNIWDYTKSIDEQEKGYSVQFNNVEYYSLDNFLEALLSNNKRIKDYQYLKIELIDSDNVFLNDYKKQHPELQDK